MREKKVIVIGAGFGGLAAGSYLLMNGYKTHILEKTNQSGGIAVTRISNLSQYSCHYQ